MGCFWWMLLLYSYGEYTMMQSTAEWMGRATGSHWRESSSSAEQLFQTIHKLISLCHSSSFGSCMNAQLIIDSGEHLYMNPWQTKSMAMTRD